MNKIIVLEGIHDEMKIKSIFPNAQVVLTNGREISKDTIELLKKLSKENEIIVFTDPDFPGEKIREIIAEAVPTIKHAFLRKKDAISTNHKKVGIEHASKEAIIESLKMLYSNDYKEPTINMLDLFELGLNGSKDSAILRNKLSEELNIGRPNAKSFLKRLNMIQMSKEELRKRCQVVKSM
ncbi:MAG: ribonuclease M5 [Anaeroplasmataceae bacterium]|nr:ribonuclease M5 [Anaeroplasmataceae bacterium]MDE7100805.1 ribonuclease M5 [Anaeroplasmataceae bacterium]